MDVHYARQLLAIECELQALITEREGMIISNSIRTINGDYLLYGEVEFQKHADKIRHLYNEALGIGR